MVLLYVDNKGEGSPGSLENNGLMVYTLSMSISEEDNSGMLFEACLSAAITSYTISDIIKGCM